MNVLRKIIILLLGVGWIFYYVGGGQTILFYLGPLLAILYIIIQTAYKYILNMDVQIMNLPQKIGLVAYCSAIIPFLQLMTDDGMGFEAFGIAMMVILLVFVGNFSMFIGFIIMKPGD